MLRSFLIASFPDAKNLQNTFLYKYSSNVTILTSCHFYHMFIYLRIVMPLGKKVFLLTRSRLRRNGLFCLRLYFAFTNASFIYCSFSWVRSPAVRPRNLVPRPLGDAPLPAKTEKRTDLTPKKLPSRLPSKTINLAKSTECTATTVILCL